MLGHDRNGVTLALDAATLKRTDIRPLLKNITTPTLVICGDADRATPIELSREMASAIAGSRLEVLAGVGHHAPLEDPAAVTAALSRFISGVGYA
jgi:pimeloyl-ACP methyl ester carboxylesterase